MRASAFAAGREEEEVRALWKAARQKVRFSRGKRRVRKHHKKQATGNMSIIPQCIDYCQRGYSGERRLRSFWHVVRRRDESCPMKAGASRAF